ncbi:glutathione S-transferase N-terminal domain-containing protein [Microcoleus sp. AR_TQ3_B6]|uniref:glutathione S-transferase N-terminal domain-containing protein n=1 Tax=Microcoleus sp. AR_TQ3_B6 TaxID=3055284 RepID=UPI002FD04D20
MSKLVVYGTPVSTYVRTVRLLLEEIAVDYTLHRVDILNGENKSAEYLAKNPFVDTPRPKGARILGSTSRLAR